MWGSNDVEWAAIDSIGRSGGILVMWDTNLIRVTDQIRGEFSLTLFCEQINSNRK